MYILNLWKAAKKWKTAQNQIKDTHEDVVCFSSRANSAMDMKSL